MAPDANDPKMDGREDLYDFWNQESPPDNFFSAAGPNPRSATIVAALATILKDESRILEVGCNVGRNLNHLYQAGYRNLAGIEISEPAVRRLREGYPDLADIPIYVGPAEETLPKLGSNSFDVVFTMAVLEHVHPESSVVFDEMVRIPKRHVLAIEPMEGFRHTSHRQHPWDIEREFTARGLKLRAAPLWSALWPMPRTAENFWHKAFASYRAYLFRIPRQRPTAQTTDSNTGERSSPRALVRRAKASAKTRVKSLRSPMR